MPGPKPADATGLCNDGTCLESDRQKIEDDVSKANGQGRLATIFLVTGGAGVAAGVVCGEGVAGVAAAGGAAGDAARAGAAGVTGDAAGAAGAVGVVLTPGSS